MGTNTYAYDPIGNRTETVENGLTTTYAANSLNQYTALNPASPDPTPFTYDPDGNMTSDGIWSYSWDAENRLIEVQPLVTNLDSTLVQYMYDSQSRRIARREFSWNDYLGETTWHYVQGRAFLYDDWNLLEERKPAIVPRTPHPYISQTNLSLTGIGGPVAAEYVWGLDLSSTLQGSGGIGGFLMQCHSDTNSPWFSFCDANGNIIDLLDEDGALSAHYEYDSYGNTVTQLGNCTPSNDFFFSTKIVDAEAQLQYFGYRYYSLPSGRWISRDPVTEFGGPNIYAFVRNAPLNHIDPKGLYNYEWEDDFSEHEKQMIENSIHCVALRIKELISQIDKHIEYFSACACYEEMITGLMELKMLLFRMLNDIDNPTYNLEIYRKDFHGKYNAMYWPSRVFWYDDELILDNEWFNLPPETRNTTMFHELTHGQGTIDTNKQKDLIKDFYNNADNLQKLMCDDVHSLQRFVYDEWLGKKRCSGHDK